MRIVNGKGTVGDLVDYPVLNRIKKETMLQSEKRMTYFIVLRIKKEVPKLDMETWIKQAECNLGTFQNQNPIPCIVSLNIICQR